MPTTDLEAQIERLIELDVPRLAGLSTDRLRHLAGELPGPDGADSILVVHPTLVSASRLAELLSLNGKTGFVVPDMTDLDEFVDIEDLGVPDRPLYLINNVDRGDAMANWSPAEALPAIRAADRTPLTVNEGISWLLQQPDRLEKNRCFMTIGSRKPKGKDLDRRTPAIWFSGGSDLDGGKERRGAPKVGWCWAGNRHTWLGFASAHSRR